MIKWTGRTQIVNVDTDLRKVWAVRTDDATGVSHTFFAKGLMKSDDDQKKIWDNLWAQWLVAKAESEQVDVMIGKLKTSLEAKELV